MLKSKENIAKIDKAMKRHHWLYKWNSTDIVMMKDLGKGKVIGIVLARVIEGYFLKSLHSSENEFLSYKFYSKISKYCPRKGAETRLCLSAVQNLSLIRTLVDADLWEEITNKDFIDLNKHNKRNKIKREKDYNELYNAKRIK